MDSTTNAPHGSDRHGVVPVLMEPVYQTKDDCRTIHGKTVFRLNVLNGLVGLLVACAAVNGCINYTAGLTASGNVIRIEALSKAVDGIHSDVKEVRAVQLQQSRNKGGG